MLKNLFEINGGLSCIGFLLKGAHPILISIAIEYIKSRLDNFDELNVKI